MTEYINAFCTQCRSRCGCIAVVEDGRLQRIEPDPEHPSGRALCPKGKAAPELVYHKDRLTTPLRRVSPKGQRPVEWKPISWDVALDEIAGKMDAIRADAGPEQVAFSVTTPSGTHMSDGISWVERFIRAYGSPNSIYSTEICNWHKDQTTKLTYGSDIGTPDFANTDCVLLWGHNPTATWLARNVEVQDALRRGAKMVVVDPRRTVLARRADVWLPVKPGTDQTLALGLIRLILASGQLDKAHVTENTNAALLVRKDTGGLLREADVLPDGAQTTLLGTDGRGWIRFCEETNRWLDPTSGLRLGLTGAGDMPANAPACETVHDLLLRRVTPFDAATVEALTGVPADALQAAAETLVRSKSVAYYAWNGVGQSAEATQTDRAISILYGLLGHLGKPGGNLPGSPFKLNDIAGHDLLDKTQKAKALGVKGRPLGPPSMGWVTAADVYRAIRDKAPYPVRMLFSFGGNLLLSQPDPALAQEALGSLELHVHADFFINDTAELADIVLPVATSWEREGLRAGFDSSLRGMRKAQLRPAVIDPVGQSKSDIDIVLALSKRLGLQDHMFGCDLEAGHDHHLAPSGITVADMRAAASGIEVGAQPHFSDQAFRERFGLIRIFSEALRALGQPPVPEGNDIAPQEDNAVQPPLVLSCAKDVAFCHSQGRNIESLRRLRIYPELELSPATAKAHGVTNGDWVKITTDAGHFTARAKVSDNVADGCVFSQHGWQRLAVTAAFPSADVNYNAVVDTTATDPVSGSINVKRIACELSVLSAG